MGATSIRAGRRGLRLRALSAGTLAVLLVLTAVAGWGTHVVVRDQERRLLVERTSEVGLVLTTSVGAIPPTLTALGRVLESTGDSDRAFTEAAASDVAAGPGSLTFALLRPEAGGYVVVAAAGKGLVRRQIISGPRAVALGAALRTKEMVATPVIGRGASRVLGFALGPPAAPTGTVLYRQVALGPVSAPRQAGLAPFHEVQVALYASSQVNPAQVLVTTSTHLPLRGSVAYQPMPVGGSRWLLGVRASQPLVGSVAAAAPWVALVGGLLGALLIAWLVEAEGRRRDTAIALYASEHQLAETLQRSLLPALPDFDGLDVAAKYLASRVGQEVGGDWFDVFPIDDGRVGVVIGDVVGHDMVAAAAMAQVRAALRAYAWQGDDPSTVMTRLDQIVNAFEIAPMVTVFYGVLGPALRNGARVFRYANAGHPAPLVKFPDGRVGALDGGRSIVIGAPSTTARGQADETLPAGSTVVLFTDGLVETPGGDINDSLTELATAVGRLRATVPVEVLCEQILAATSAATSRDDVAVLAVHLVDDTTSPAPRPRAADANAAPEPTGVTL